MQIFNSYTGQKEEFRPLEPGVVRMYVCGDTVYDYTHIGHARSMVAFGPSVATSGVMISEISCMLRSLSIRHVDLSIRCRPPAEVQQGAL